MNLVKLQDMKLIHRNLLHFFYILTMKDQKEKLGEQSHLPLHKKKKKAKTTKQNTKKDKRPVL